MKKLLILALCLTAALAGCRESTPEAAATVTAPSTMASEPTQAYSPVMTHQEFLDAGLETTVVVETYVQAVQEWWNDTITVYAQSEDGGYFLRNMVCSREDAAMLAPGTRIRVTGVKRRWAGSDQIEYGSFTPLEGFWMAPTLDVTSLLGSESLLDHQNEKISFTGLTIDPIGDAGEAFLYRWDGSGSPGDDSDLFFQASLDGESCLFVIPYYLCGPESDAYQTVVTMEVGDTVNLEGFLYWYDGPQPHITSVEIVSR